MWVVLFLCTGVRFVGVGGHPCGGIDNSQGRIGGMDASFPLLIKGGTDRDIKVSGCELLDLSGSGLIAVWILSRTNQCLYVNMGTPNFFDKGLDRDDLGEEL